METIKLETPLCYGFFDCAEGTNDRTYSAEDFTSYLSSIICNGILDTWGGQFSPSSDESVLTIGSGYGWIDGHYAILKQPQKIDMKQYADASLYRYVAVGISCDADSSVRSCAIEVAIGLAGESSIASAKFVNTDTKKYLPICTVRIDPTGKISGIYDNREFVKCILGKCGVTELQDSMEALEKNVSKKIADFSSRLEVVERKFGSLGEGWADEITFLKDENGLMYYLDENGDRLAGMVRINGVPYRFYDDGTLCTGWQTVFEKRYYYDTSNGNIVLGWLTLNDERYYITMTDGKLVNQYRTIDGVDYHFDADGVAQQI